MSVKFAVVGHPNKGKSTIVSNLAMDDSIAISKVPGTTTKSKEYTLKVDGKSVYTLIDTPGFQRPRQVLAYLESKNAPAHKRLDVVKEFIEEFKDNPKFKDDIELLKPLVEGAGVLYIVDASKPYTLEYENDMKILSYLGRPSMAILNFIDSKSDYSKEWKSVLTHYFKLIKRFNPMLADINEYIDLLEAISHLNEEWREPLKKSIWAFKELFKQRVKKSSKSITDMIFDIALYKKTRSFSEDERVKKEFIKEYKKDIKKFEKRAFFEILKVWEHKSIEVDINDIALDDIELFSKEAAEIFGLSQKDFILYSAATGATIGAGIDLAFLGHTLFAGAGLGAILGGVGAYFGYEKAFDIKIKGFSLGKKYLELGPLEDVNLLFILLQRAISYTKDIATLSYAKRGKVSFELKRSEILTPQEKKKFFKLHKSLINEKNLDTIKIEYQELLEKVINRVLREKD